MNVRVKLFAAAKDLAGGGEMVVAVPERATVADVRRAVAAAAPELAGLVGHSLWAVDATYADDATPISEQSEVAFIPPVSGG